MRKKGLILGIFLSFIIIFFMIIPNCSTAGSSGGGGGGTTVPVNLDNILGGWIYCNDLFTPSKSIKWDPDYPMMHIKTDKTDFGYINNPDGGDFWTYYDPVQTFAGVSTSSASGDWIYQYTSPGGQSFTYSVGYDYIRGTVTSQPYKYYQMKFYYQNPSTNAIVYYGYSSDGNYKEKTSEPSYFKKIDNFNNKGNNNIEIR